MTEAQMRMSKKRRRMVVSYLPIRAA